MERKRNPGRIGEINADLNPFILLFLYIFFNAYLLIKLEDGGQLLNTSEARSSLVKLDKIYLLPLSLEAFVCWLPGLERVLFFLCNTAVLCLCAISFVGITLKVR